MAFQLSSAAFKDGERIPDRYTCTGQDISPPLAWSGAPEGARSFALLCDDPDAPGGTWHHWAVFDLPADTRSLPEAYPTDATVGTSRQAVNDFRRTGYGGPCPPPGHGVHHYRFRLLALTVARLDLDAKARCLQVEAAARPHILAEARLTGTYARAP
jgi:Raf kinase inhibitor-like YbhB/YbcL family protein